MCEARLYVKLKKTHLYCTAINFLGHHISAAGIEADNSKVDKILHWPRPKSATKVHSFLGLVCYISVFLLNLAHHMDILNGLTMKASEHCFPTWTVEHQRAFDSIKSIVIGCDSLVSIDHDDETKKIYVTTDASNHCSGAILSFGDNWETARPVAFESMTFKDAELNYPVHEKELLAIIRALHKWRANLLRSFFTVFMDHKMLENFNTQKDLSQRQACWMEFLSQFDFKIMYVKGEDNTVANALSHYPTACDDDFNTNNTVLLGQPLNYLLKA